MVRLFALLFGVLALTAPTRAQTPYPLLNQHVPAFSAPLASGGTLTEQALKGKWTVLEFWGIWCEDSMGDFKHTKALARAIAADPSLQFVTVHVDPRYGRWTSVAAFARDEGITYPIALDPRREVMRAFQVTSTPTYLVIDPDGVIRASQGELRKDPAPEGGVKALIKEIARLKAEH